jgi:hypothetical protein
LEKGKRVGGIGQKAIFYLSNRTEAGEGADRAAGPAGAGDCQRPRVGDGRGLEGNGEEDKGYLSRLSPWSGTACGGGSTARNGRPRRLAAAAQMVAVVEKGSVARAR